MALILTALDMTANMAKKLEEILERLKKLNVIESSVKSIETKLNCLEERTAVLENFRQTTEEDINDLKENGNFTSSSITHLRANSEGEGGGGDENLLSFPSYTQS